MTKSKNDLKKTIRLLKKERDELDQRCEGLIGKNRDLQDYSARLTKENSRLVENEERLTRRFEEERDETRFSDGQLGGVTQCFDKLLAEFAMKVPNPK